ncbi:class I SAM-dependent methyltransferase [Oceanomicrobium pacificus]|uniref:Class I SAM-dependent methyltransferase n=1 Tax=Oceanomicrobium pacificus TaxID=2692916 RepID=A0A6B0TTI0_9RHOB|nr:class I SAM-dependent methyltransferase [Oceanomicrobium pacificus]MXU64542.1 class I SAM-dependent methyltransferase [Oceanomicrobium pacificus]
MRLPFNFLLIRRRRPFYSGPEVAELEPGMLEGARLLPTREELISLLPPDAVGAEIGVAFGDFTKRLLEIARPSELHLIDLWQGERYSAGRESVERLAAKEPDGRCRIHIGTSLEMLEKLPDRSLDWAYLDTDHTYATTAAELAILARKLKPDGILAGDDYSHGNPGVAFEYGVRPAVNEFCLREGWKFIALTMEHDRFPSFALKKM